MDEKIPLESGRPPCVVRAAKPGTVFVRCILRIGDAEKSVKQQANNDYWIDF